MRKVLLSLLLVSTTFVLFYSCRRTELQPETQQEISKASTEHARFFNVPASASAEAKAIAEAIKKQNEKYNFLSSVIKKAGYPVWDKAVLFNSGLGKAGGRAASDSSKEVAYIPFVLDSGRRTNAVLSVEMGATDSTYRLLLLNNYKALGYDTTDRMKWNAYKAFTLFTAFDYNVFGYTKFLVRDTALFKPSSDSMRVVATIKSTPNQIISGRTQSGFYEWIFVYLMCEKLYNTTQAVRSTGVDCIEWTNALFGAGGGTGNNGNNGGPSTGNGGTGTGGPSGGWTGWGSGTGNPPGSGWYGGGTGGSGSGSDCNEATSVKTNGTNCGTGWTPVLDENWFNSLLAYNIDYTALQPYPCIQNIVSTVVNLNNSTIKIIKDIFNESSKFDIKFVLNPNLNVAALLHTNPPAFTSINGSLGKLVSLKFDLQLNPNIFTVSTKFYIAESVMHEMIHAYFWYRQMDAVNDPIKIQILDQELGFLKPYDPNVPNAPSNHHEQMANSYIDKLAEALKEFRILTTSDLDAWRAKYPSITLDDYYRANAWAGLTKDPRNDNYITLGWKAFEQNNPAKAAMYRDIIIAEQEGTDKGITQQKCQ